MKTNHHCLYCGHDNNDKYACLCFTDYYGYLLSFFRLLYPDPYASSLLNLHLYSVTLFI